MTKTLPSPKQPKLSKLEQAFIKGLLQTGGNLTQAILSTGHKGKNPSAAASQIWRRSHVREAFKAALADALSSSRALSLKTFKDIAEHGDSENARLMAAKELNAWADSLEGMAKASTGGITINIGMRSDTGATQTIDITPQRTDEQGAITASEGDDTSH